MKISILLLTLPLIGVLVPAAHGQDAAPEAAPQAVPAELSAAQILTKSRQTYAALSVYRGACSVVRDVVIAVGDGEPTQNVSSASATIDFARGERLTIAGVDMGGNPFKAQWTPRESWIEQYRAADKGAIAEKGAPARRNYRDEPNYRAVDGMMAGLSGFTGGVGSAIPNALMPDRFDLGNPLLQLGTAKLLAPRQLGTKLCYVVQVTIAELNRVDTYWIERDSFLLRRLTEEVGEQRFDDLPKINGEPLPTYRVAYSLSQFVFATTQAK